MSFDAVPGAVRYEETFTVAGQSGVWGVGSGAIYDAGPGDFCNATACEIPQDVARA